MRHAQYAAQALANLFDKSLLADKVLKSDNDIHAGPVDMCTFEKMLRRVVIKRPTKDVQNFCANVIDMLGSEDSDEVSLSRFSSKPLKLRILSANRSLKDNLADATKERYAREAAKKVSLVFDSFNLVDVVPALNILAKNTGMLFVQKRAHV